MESAYPTDSSDASSAKDVLFSAALRLAVTAAVHVVGRLTTQSGTRVLVDARVSNHGPIIATLGVAGHTAEYIAVGGRRFVRGGLDARDALGLDRRTTVAYAGGWVEVGSTLAGIDFSTVLNVRLGWSINDIDGPREFIRGGGEQVPAAAQVRVGDLLVWISAHPPARILGLRGVLGQPRDADLDVDLELREMTDSQLVRMYTELSCDRVPELFEAIGSAHPGTVSGSTALDPCGPSGCLATVTLSNTVGIPGGRGAPTHPLTFSARIEMKLDGALIKTSSLSVKMLPNARATVRSFLSYVIPPSPRPTTHRVDVTTHIARESDLDVVVSDLVADLKRIRCSAAYVWGSCPEGGPTGVV